MNRTIKKVAVLGSGVMGSRIACHFAGAGLQVLLLYGAQGPKRKYKAYQKNKLINDALRRCKSNPSLSIQDLIKNNYRKF
jgi:3-hydroxyacyl-CoA dehydrogenase